VDLSKKPSFRVVLEVASAYVQRPLEPHFVNVSFVPEDFPKRLYDERLVNYWSTTISQPVLLGETRWRKMSLQGNILTMKEANRKQRWLSHGEQKFWWWLRLERWVESRKEVALFEEPDRFSV
jgi:hypothetical protein